MNICNHLFTIKSIYNYIHWGDLPTWIAGAGAIWFACQQTKINKRQFLLSRRQKYIDSSINLSEIVEKTNQIINHLIPSANKEPLWALHS